MKICDKRGRVMQSFNSILVIGTTFDYEGKIYMMVEKVCDDDGNYYNALCLNDGEFAHFNNEKVQVLYNVVLEIR